MSAQEAPIDTLAGKSIDIDVDTFRTDERSRSTSIKGIHGQLGIGLTYGGVPNTFDNRPMNYMVDGQLGLTLIGIPLIVEGEATSAVPIRGRRNGLRISLDHRKLFEERQLEKQSSLHTIRSEIDSIKAQLAALHRMRSSLERRIQLKNVGPDKLELDTLQGLSFTEPVFDTISILLSLPSDGSSIGPDLPDHEEKLMRLNEQIDMMTGMLEELKQEEVRRNAIVNVSRPGLLKKNSTLFIERIDIGDCEPLRSTYLINGVGFNGVTTEFSSGGYSVAISHGKSYDDLWLSQDIGEVRSRQAQQLFFFNDPEGSDPRKLSAITVGRGNADKRYVRIGMLYGRRSHTVPGSLLRDDISYGTQHNHVFEIVAGTRIKEGHDLELTIARAFNRYEDNGLEDPGPGWRPDAAQQYGLAGMAGALRWSSSFFNARTLIKINARLTGDEFQSIGVGFLRPGTRSIGADVEQRLGKRIRIRAGLFSEQRRTIREGIGMQLHRARFMVNYKLSGHLVLRGTFMPQRTILMTMDRTSQYHQMAGIGITLKYKVGKRSISFDGDINHYTMAFPVDQETTFLRGGVNLIGKLSTVGLRANLWRAQDQAECDISLYGQTSVTKKLTIEGEGTVPIEHLQQCAWTLAATHKLASWCSVSIMTSRIGRRDIFFFNNDVAISNFSYNCGGRLIFTW